MTRHSPATSSRQGIPPDPTGDCWRGPPGPPGSGDTSPVTATGSTTPRILSDRFADWLNVKDFGAKLDGTTNDNAAFQAAYTAADTGDTIYVSNGRIGPGLLNPTRASGNVIWQTNGLNFGTGAIPLTFFGDGDIVETNVAGSRKGFYKQLINHGAPLATVEIGLWNKSTFMTPTAITSGPIVTTQSFPGNTGRTWGIQSALTAGSVGAFGNDKQEGGFISAITKPAGCLNQTFQYWGFTNDLSGLSGDNTVQDRGGMIGIELDMQFNGPEHPASSYNPAVGSREYIHLSPGTWKPPVWQASHAYSLNDAIQPTAANGFTYVCTVAGTSGSVQPTWPTSTGTVTDGSVTWKYGTTIAAQMSRAIGIATRPGDDLSYAAGVSVDANIYDAAIELSGCTMVGASAAGIRLAANMPIDFSGNLTAAGQNQHTLKYDSAAGKLFYAVAGVNKWSVDASGNMRCAGTVTGSVTP